MAHVTALAAARGRGAPTSPSRATSQPACASTWPRVLAGERRHVTIDRALRLLGLGTGCIESVDADDQGRMRAGALAAALRGGGGPTIVCAQAGEVNTGAFDPFVEIAETAKEAGAWLHVDGAFGLWAAASPELRGLTGGVEQADSWATDAHKWLNVPYDCGIVFCAHPAAHQAAIGVSASYLVQDEQARLDGENWTPELSRRARGVPVYAALRSLGSDGVARLVERCCRHARALAGGLEAHGGFEVLNEVVLNQVLFRHRDGDARTAAVLRHVQESGEAWLGGTTWNGAAALRLSVSNWSTDGADVERTLAAFAAASEATA
jgi:glutamate/tyrosine decarboxylase-like PLP-dependent enzyme